LRIIIDIDDDVWADAFLDWDEANGNKHATWAQHTKAVRKRLLAALVMEIERIRFIEEEIDLDDEGDGDDE
jgi:L-rhamnose isomerase